MSLFPTNRIDILARNKFDKVNDGTSNTLIVTAINFDKVKDGTSNTLTIGR